MLLNLNPPANTERQAKCERRQIVREIKTVLAVVHTVQGKSETEVAASIEVGTERLRRMKETPAWHKSYGWYTGTPVIVEKTTRRSVGNAGYRDHKPALFDAQDGICNGCRYKFHSHHLSVDHIVPKCKGGSNEIANLQLLCNPCNGLKGKEPHEALLKKLTERGVDVSPDTYNTFGVEHLNWSNRIRRFGARAVFVGFFFLVSLAVVIQP